MSLLHCETKGLNSHRILVTKHVAAEKCVLKFDTCNKCRPNCIITDRVRSTRGGNIFSLFVCPHLGGGGVPTFRMGGGYLLTGLDGGGGYLPSRSGGGGVPTFWLVGGGGVPTFQVQVGGGGTYLLAGGGGYLLSGLDGGGYLPR